MSEHFIREIEIKNFKCFEDFKAEGFGRVNLIGGKNNVGKTALMEALQFSIFVNKLEDKYPVDYQYILMYIFENRNIQKVIDRNFTNFDAFNAILPLEINNIKIELLPKDFEFVLKINNNETGIKEVKLGQVYHINNFISSMYILDIFIEKQFNIILKKRLRDKLNKALHKFDKNIEEFSIIDNIPQVFLTNQNKFVALSAVGHGFKRYISIILAVLTSDTNIIFIDEIENGIHYMKLDEMWKLILEISKQQNVQVFATTHSKECIESYARVAKKLEDKEITFIELGRNDNNEIESIIYPYEWLIDEIEQNHEVRGW
jgi:AAA15 family ATPase/GTPase